MMTSNYNQTRERKKHCLAREKAVLQAISMLNSYNAVDYYELLSVLGRAFGVSRAYIIYFKDKGGKIDNSYEWCSLGVEPWVKNVQGKDTAQLSLLINKMINSKYIFSDACDYLRERGIRSSLIIPIIFASNVRGIIGFSEANCARIWSEDDELLIRLVSESLADYAERKRLEEQLEYLKLHDQLTGLYNRDYLEEKLTRLDGAEHLPLTMILGSVNGLKFINSNYGRTMGDQILRNSAQVLKSSCNSNSIIARWSGDEFAILLPKTNFNEAKQICELIQWLCQEAYAKPTHRMSLGVATKDDFAQSVEELITLAEERMYRNKLVEDVSNRSSIISSLQKTLDERTHETKEHAQRIKNLSSLMGHALGLSASWLDELTLLALLHDIGKIAIPDNILLKPGPLTAEEWEVMKKHPEIGFRIVQASSELSHIAPAILSHHERWDGKGYPRGLRSDNIPFASRILGIIDAYDVITHERSYKRALPHLEALHEIEKSSGSQFDPELTKVFLEMMRNQEEVEIGKQLIRGY